MSTVDPYRTLLHELHRAALLSERVADRALLASVGIGRTQFLILRTVGEAPELAGAQQRLADHLGLTKAAVSRHVLACRHAGWLTMRTELSRREHALELTARGRRLVATGRTVQDAAERRALDVLGVRRLESGAATLAKLSAMLEAQLLDE